MLAHSKLKAVQIYDSLATSVKLAIHAIEFRMLADIGLAMRKKAFSPIGYRSILWDSRRICGSEHLSRQAHEHVGTHILKVLAEERTPHWNPGPVPTRSSTLSSGGNIVDSFRNLETSVAFAPFAAPEISVTTLI